MLAVFLKAVMDNKDAAKEDGAAKAHLKELRCFLEWRQQQQSHQVQWAAATASVAIPQQPPKPGAGKGGKQQAQQKQQKHKEPKVPAAGDDRQQQEQQQQLPEPVPEAEIVSGCAQLRCSSPLLLPMVFKSALQQHAAPGIELSGLHDV